MNLRSLRLAALASVIASPACTPTPRQPPIVVVESMGRSRTDVLSNAWLQDQTPVCGEVFGRVLDRRSGRPLERANVFIPTRREGVATDTAGVFRFRPTVSGLQVIHVRAVGYGPVEFVAHVDSGVPRVFEVRLEMDTTHSDRTSTIVVTQGWGRCPAPA